MTTEIEELCALLRSPSYWKSSDGYSEAFDNAPYRAADHIERLVSENEALREALHQIFTLRPAGDVATATNTRALVQKMEIIARAALSKKGEGE